MQFGFNFGLEKMTVGWIATQAGLIFCLKRVFNSTMKQASGTKEIIRNWLDKKNKRPLKEAGKSEAILRYPTFHTVLHTTNPCGWNKDPQRHTELQIGTTTIYLNEISG